MINNNICIILHLKKKVAAAKATIATCLSNIGDHKIGLSLSNVRRVPISLPLQWCGCIICPTLWAHLKKWDRKCPALELILYLLEHVMVL